MKRRAYVSVDAAACRACARHTLVMTWLTPIAAIEAVSRGAGDRGAVRSADGDRSRTAAGSGAHSPVAAAPIANAASTGST